MKAKPLSRIGALVMACALALSLSATPAFAIGDADKGTINVTGAEKGVSVSAYKLMDVNYDYTADQPIDSMYAWAADVQAWVDVNYSAYKDANDFHDLTNEEAAAFYDKLAAAIKSGTVSLAPAKTATADDTGAASLADLDMANYLVLIENGVNVYRPSAVNLVPTWNDTTKKWEMSSPANVQLKTSTPTIDKEVNGDAAKSAGIGDTVSYKLTGTVPVYPENALGKTYSISDILSTGLTLDASSIKVTSGDKTLVAGTDYTVKTPGALTDGTPTSFTLDFVYDNIKDLSSIEVTYDATINENAVVGEAGNPNKAHLEYNNNPYNETTVGDVPSTEPKVYTYGIDLTKQNSTGEKLAGAEFTLAGAKGDIKFIKISDGAYRVAKADETDAITSVVSDSNGKIVINGLNVGTYTLTETVAPGGYNKLQTPITVTFADADINGKIELDGTETNSAYAPVLVVNKQGFELPTTGGMGTLLFTVAGAAILAGAALIFLAARRKAKDNA